MNIFGKKYKSIWFENNKAYVIDQTKLPFKIEIVEWNDYRKVRDDIKNMIVRGAPLIGVSAAFGVYFAIKEAIENNLDNSFVLNAINDLAETRPTAVNLFWALNSAKELLNESLSSDLLSKSLDLAHSIMFKEEENSRLIGENGFSLFEQVLSKKSEKKINILTHCNAGWLATVDYGTALAPIYKAFDSNIEIFVWVDETRPRNQGARLTAFELGAHGIAHKVIVDNAGGQLMQMGLVDAVIVGCDRMTANGDCVNKIGTYLKALSAYDNNIPFYVALPLSSIDLTINNPKDIEIEERNGDEVKYIEAFYDNKIINAQILPDFSDTFNLGFDITPAKYINKIITEKACINANYQEISSLFK